MIAEETCASHALSSAKIMADFSNHPLILGLEALVSKDEGAFFAILFSAVLSASVRTAETGQSLAAVG